MGNDKRPAGESPTSQASARHSLRRTSATDWASFPVLQRRPQEPDAGRRELRRHVSRVRPVKGGECNGVWLQRSQGSNNLRMLGESERLPSQAGFDLVNGAFLLWEAYARDHLPRIISLMRGRRTGG